MLTLSNFMLGKWGNLAGFTLKNGEGIFEIVEAMAKALVQSYGGDYYYHSNGLAWAYLDDERVANVLACFDYYNSPHKIGWYGGEWEDAQDVIAGLVDSRCADLLNEEGATC